MDEKKARRPLSELYVTARMVVLCVLVAFIILFVAIGHNDMRAENFRYLIRYLDRSSFSATGDFSTVYYKGKDPAFVMYKGELAVLSDGTLTLFDSDGAAVMTAGVPKDAQFASAQNESYITLFSRSDGRVYVFNSFSSVFEADFSYIYSVFAFDDGYAIVSAGNGYRTELTLYNKNFRAVYSLGTDNLITSVFLADGTLYYAAAVSDVGGAMAGGTVDDGEIGAFDTGTGEAVFKSRIEGIPLAVYLSGGRLFAASTAGIYTFNDEGEAAGRLRMKVDNAFSDGGFAVTAETGGNTCIIFAKNGRLYSGECGSVTDVCFGEHLFVLSQSAVYRLTASDIYAETDGIPTYAAGIARTDVRSGGMRIFALSDSSVLFCGSGSAFPLDTADERTG